MKGSSVLQNISKGLASLWKGCVNLFYSQMGRNKLSLQELNKGTLVYCQAEGQGPPGKPLSMIIIIKAIQTVSNMESELASSLRHVFSFLKLSFLSLQRLAIRLSPSLPQLSCPHCHGQSGVHVLLPLQVGQEGPFSAGLDPNTSHKSGENFGHASPLVFKK